MYNLFLQNTTEVLFQAKNMAEDAKFCHEQAEMMVMQLNETQTAAVSTEQALIAAAIVAPVEVVEESSAATFSISLVILLGALLMALVF